MTQAILEAAWSVLLAARAWSALGGPAATAPFGIRSAAGREPLRTGADDARAELIWRAGLFEVGPGLSEQARDLVELYLPVLGAGAGRPVVVGHLGQSLDARIATGSGDSRYVTGPENMVHLHRMRALCDAVVVGAGTVATDDPRLTTRLVAGANPVRLVIDPERRLARDRRLFTDGAADTLLVCAADRIGADEGRDGILGVARDDAGLSLVELLSALGRRGLHALFIEGGGVTVSRWMTAGLLDRLQIATAPLLIGAGRAGLSLPPAATMSACRRPPHRLYRMGEDILWDFDLRGEAAGETRRDRPPRAPTRLR